jgi:hypothetical protein
LRDRLAQGGETRATDGGAAASAPREAGPADSDRGEAVAPEETGRDESAADAPAWPDDAVESAFLAEAKERGEVVVAPKPAEESSDAEETGAVPPMGELVAKIPPAVRESLEDLFRAKFVRVVRVPKKALKG